MIRIVVELYRIALALILIFSAIVAVPVHAAFGLAGVIVYAVIVIMGLGVSAVLLSIHDHVAAMARSSDEPAPRPAAGPVLIGAGAVLAAALVYGFMSPRTPAEQKAVAAASVTDADRAACDPKLAASVGLTCPK